MFSYSDSRYPSQKKEPSHSTKLANYASQVAGYMRGMTRNRATRCDWIKQHGPHMRPAGYELLLAHFQALNQRAVARIVLALQVIEQLAAAAYQTQQAGPGRGGID